MNSRNLNLPTWDEGNTEPDLVFNQLLLVVDALLKSGVEAIEPTPPGAPEEGQAWIVGASATGAWAGHEDDIAIANTGGPGWKFITPMEGWSIWVIDPGASYRFITSWSPTGGGALTNPMTGLGDMIAGDVDGGPVRVAAGDEGQVPTVQADGTVAFQDLPTPTAGLGSAVTALSISSGTVTVDCDLGDYFTLAKTANVTALSFTNLPASGQARTIAIQINNDSTAGRTFALPSSFKAVAGSDTAVQTASNARTLIVATTFDQGTRWEYSMKALS